VARIVPLRVEGEGIVPDSAPILDSVRFEAGDTLVKRDPFAFMIATDVLSNVKRKELLDDFPKYKEAGFFPYAEAECGPVVNQLVNELLSSEVADKLGDKLGIERLSQYPTLVTICRLLNRRHGTIHTDSKSKVATALIYLNESWPSDCSGGCLRFLRTGDDIDAMLVPELKPLYGSFAFFKRADNSFHGHLPYEGERLVIQIAWLTSEEEKMRKAKRGVMTRFVKSILGGFDKLIGAGRGRNAAHLD
jgi:2OG-Fe(II) oxygenase superfamily